MPPVHAWTRNRPRVTGGKPLRLAIIIRHRRPFFIGWGGQWMRANYLRMKRPATSRTVGANIRQYRREEKQEDWLYK